MKKIQIILALGVFFVFATTQAQKRYLVGDEIPQEIISYIQNNFAESSIKKVKEEKEPLKTEYEVKLLPKMELEFDGDFNITEIESKNGVPNEVLPEHIQGYLNENHPTIKVKEWKSKPEGQKVKLVNGAKLYFDQQGNFAGKKEKN